MAASGLLRERDLHALTAVIEDGLRDDPGEAMPWVVLDRLHLLIPCDGVQFDEYDMQGHSIPTSQLTQDGGDRNIEFDDDLGHDARFWALRAEFLPYSYPMRTGDVSSVIRWSDFYTGTELKNAPWHAEFVAGFSNDKYAIFVPLPPLAGRSRRVGFWRSNRDFSERDRLALQLLRPHLHEVYLDADRRRRGIPHLSRREREVLQLASQGHSNVEIAQILFVSVATVRKHMEHIFDRTGVRTRSGAAAVALPSPLRLSPARLPENNRRQETAD